MADKISRYDVLSNFGFEVNPFKGQIMESEEMLRIRKILRMAVHDHGMISIVGERGVGKSISVIKALEQLDCRIVKTWSLDKRRLLISDIECALIQELSPDEPPKRMKEVRSLQLRTVLGSNSRNKEIVLVIEEAHNLHGMTLRALKALRELTWMGKKELLTVVLIGQADAINRAGLAEVRLRSDTVYMNGLTSKEIGGYIRTTLGDIVEESTISAFTAKNYLDLQESLIKAMAKAMIAGRKTVIAEDVVQAEVKQMPLKKQPEKRGALKMVLAQHNQDMADEFKQAVNG